MKLRNLFLASVAIAGIFSACSNEMDEVIDSSNNEQAEAYASFTFAMPASVATRAVEEGTSVENNITNVKILLFNADGSSAQSVSLARTDFTPTTSTGATYYTTKEDIAITTAGTYSVHVIVNPTARFNTIADLTAYEKAVETVAKTTGEYCDDNTFLMTNAEGKATTEVTTKNTKGNAAKVTVKVERVAAKVAFTTTKVNNVYTIADGITVKFDAYKVINTRNSAFGLRRVGANATNPTIGGAETTNYVIENFFAQKTAAFSKPVFETNYSRRYDTYVAFRKLNTNADKQPMAYCMENTMVKEAQINGWSTGVIFRGKLTIPTGKVSGTVDAATGNLYRYDGKFYATLVDLVKGTDTGWNGNDNTNNLTNDVLGIKANKGSKTVAQYLADINNRTKLYNDFRVEFFVGGYCYYATWLRHRDNGTEDMGVMEFTIVRNNVYQVSINSVTKIGSFTSGTPGAPDSANPSTGQEDIKNGEKNPEIPGDVAAVAEPKDPVVSIDPTDPDESNSVFLNVGIQVLPWTVRANNVDL